MTAAVTQQARQPGRRGRAQGHPGGRRPGGGDADRGDGRRATAAGRSGAGCWWRRCSTTGVDAVGEAALAAALAVPEALGFAATAREAPEPGPPDLHVVPDPDADDEGRAAAAETLDQAATSYDEADGGALRGRCGRRRPAVGPVAPAAGRARRAAAPARRPRDRARRGRRRASVTRRTSGTRRRPRGVADRARDAAATALAKLKAATSTQAVESGCESPGRSRGPARRSRRGRGRPASRSSRCRPRRGSRGGRAAVANASSSARSSSSTLDLLLLGRRGEVEVVEVEQPAPARRSASGWSSTRRSTATSSQAAVPGAVPDDEERRRLPAALVATRRVAGASAASSRSANAVSGSDVSSHASCIASTTSGPTRTVALDRVAVAGQAAGPGDARRAGVGRRAAVDVDDADLAVVAAIVLLEQPVERDRRRRALVEVGKRKSLVGDVGVGLGGDRADHRRRRPGPRDPTARNFEATATPHDSPSADRATIENVMAGS